MNDDDFPSNDRLVIILKRILSTHEWQQVRDIPRSHRLHKVHPIHRLIFSDDSGESPQGGSDLHQRTKAHTERAITEISANRPDWLQRPTWKTDLLSLDHTTAAAA